MPMFVSDFFDFSIYVDAAESDIEQYIERFQALRKQSSRMRPPTFIDMPC